MGAQESWRTSCHDVEITELLLLQDSIADMLELQHGQHLCVGAEPLSGVLGACPQ